MITCPNCKYKFKVIQEMNEDGTEVADLDSPENPYKVGEKMDDIECPLCEQEFDILKISNNQWQTIIHNRMPTTD